MLISSKIMAEIKEYNYIFINYLLCIKHKLKMYSNHVVYFQCIIRFPFLTLFIFCSPSTVLILDSFQYFSLSLFSTVCSSFPSLVFLVYPFLLFYAFYVAYAIVYPSVSIGLTLYLAN